MVQFLSTVGQQIVVEHTRTPNGAVNYGGTPNGAVEHCGSIHVALSCTVGLLMVLLSIIVGLQIIPSSMPGTQDGAVEPKVTPNNAVVQHG